MEVDDFEVPLTADVIKTLKRANFVFRGCLEDFTGALQTALEDKEAVPEDFQSSEMFETDDDSCSHVSAAVFGVNARAALCTCHYDSCKPNTVFPLTEPPGLYCFDEALTWGSICGGGALFVGGTNGGNTDFFNFNDEA